jgi:hypothetical protein
MSASIVAGLAMPERICDKPKGFAAPLAQLATALAIHRADKQKRQREVLPSKPFKGQRLIEELEHTYRQKITRQRDSLLMVCGSA